MPTERIFISPQEFRATSVNSNVTFSSNNKYFKTATSGAFKVGGFDRAPFILGTNYQTDRLDAGGYLSISPGNYTDYIYIDVPFANSVMKMCGPSYTSNINDGKYSFTEINNNSQPGAVYMYSPNRPYKINGETAPGTYSLLAGSTPFPGAIPMIWPGGFDFSKPGIYEFGPKYSDQYPWYSWYDNSVVSGVTASLLNTRAWKPLSCFFTQATTNIDLVVTV